MPSYQLPDGSRTSPDAPAGLTKQDIAEHYQGQHGTKLWLNQKEQRMKDVWWKAALRGINPMNVVRNEISAAKAERDAMKAGRIGPTMSPLVRPVMEAGAGLVGMLGPDELTWALNKMGVPPEDISAMKDPKTGKIMSPSKWADDLLDKYTTPPETRYGQASEFVASMGLGGLGAPAPKFARVAPEIRELARRGIVTTPGQRAASSRNPLMQGAGQIEELASRIPGLGAFIKHSRGTSVLQAARAQVDEAARIAGEPIPPEGLSVHGAVENVRAGLDRRYDSLLSRMRANRSTRAPTTQLPGGGIVNVPGDAFEHVIAQTQIQAGNVLTGTAELKAFDNIIKRVNRDFDAQGNISGENLKELERFLRHEHSRYERSASPATQDLAPFIAQIQDGFNAMLRLGNAPADVAELDRLDRAYSQFKMVERASTNKAALAKTGEFTPAAMLGEVSHRALKRGEAGRRLMSTETAQGQRLAAQSSRVLGNKLPDSGTPTGQFFLEMLSSPTAAGTAGAFGYPKLAAAAAAIPSIYNQPVLRFLQNRALSPYGNLGPLLGIAGAGVETSQAQKPVQDTLPNALVPSDWQVPK